MHGTVLSGKYVEISGDAQGTVAGYVEQKLGAPMLYINGAAGNIAPIYSVYDTPRSGHLTQFNVLLGDRILAANRAIDAATSGCEDLGGREAARDAAEKRHGVDGRPALLCRFESVWYAAGPSADSIPETE